MNCTRRRILSGLMATFAASMIGCTRRAPFRISGHPWPGYEPLFFAESQKLLPEQVVLQHLPTLSASIDALKQGTTDAGMLTLDEVIALQAQGINLQVILVMDISKGADALITTKNIKALPQLRGKRIGLEPSTLGELMLSMVLEKSSLTRADIKPVFYAFEEQEAAFNSGRLDALITYEPIAGRLVAAGATKLLSTRDLPDCIFDVFVVKTEVAKDYADALQQTLRGHFLALDQLRRNPWDTVYRMVPHAGVSAEELIDSLRGMELPDLVANQSYLKSTNSYLATVSDKLSKIMMASGTIKKPANTENFFTDAYLPKSLQ